MLRVALLASEERTHDNDYEQTARTDRKKARGGAGRDEEGRRQEDGLCLQRLRRSLFSCSLRVQACVCARPELAVSASHEGLRRCAAVSLSAAARLARAVASPGARARFPGHSPCRELSAQHGLVDARSLGVRAQKQGHRDIDSLKRLLQRRAVGDAQVRFAFTSRKRSRHKEGVLLRGSKGGCRQPQERCCEGELLQDRALPLFCAAATQPPRACRTRERAAILALHVTRCSAWDSLELPGPACLTRFARRAIPGMPRVTRALEAPRRVCACRFLPARAS
eukprot:250345-Rhodomonas_salina.2